MVCGDAGDDDDGFLDGIAILDRSKGGLIWFGHLTEHLIFIFLLVRNMGDLGFFFFHV